MKDNIVSIVKKTKETFNKTVITGFVGYRDFCDGKDQFTKSEFSENALAIEEHLLKV
jgi:hypothetical protein